MVLVEKHIIKPKHKDYDELDNLCWLSKNLYNSTLYIVNEILTIVGFKLGS